MGTCRSCTACTDDMQTAEHDRPQRPPYFQPTTSKSHTITLSSPTTAPLFGRSSAGSNRSAFQWSNTPPLGYSTPVSNDPNSFESLILDQDKFLMDLADFIAKMNVTAKRRLWDHRVVSRQSDGSKTIQSEISQQAKQMVHFLIDWCVVYTKFLDRGKPPTKVSRIKPHMEHIGLYIFNNWNPIKQNRFISEKCYFSNMIKMYVNRFMKCSVNDINKILIQCQLIDNMGVPDYLTQIIAEYIVEDFQCNLHENMIMKISSERNHETIYSIPNMFDDGNRRYYRTGNKEYLLLLINLSTRHHVYNKDDNFYKQSRNGFININDINITDYKSNDGLNGGDREHGEHGHRKRDSKGFIITNIQIVSPMNDINGVDKCTIWIFDDERLANMKYIELNEYHSNADIMSDDNDEESVFYPEIEESISYHQMHSMNEKPATARNRRFKPIRDENKYIAKWDGIRNMEDGKISQDMSFQGKYVLFKFKSNEYENACVDIANISIRVARL